MFFFCWSIGMIRLRIWDFEIVIGNRRLPFFNNPKSAIRDPKLHDASTPSRHYPVVAILKILTPVYIKLDILMFYASING
jgi:hypothetical protein